MDLLAAAANGVVSDADQPSSAKSSVVRDLLSEEFDANSLFGDDVENQDEEVEKEPIYKGSPSKRVERKGDDDDDAEPEKESTQANTGTRRGRSASPNTFTMPSAGDRVWIKYDNGAEFFATVFYPDGWKKGEALLAFDDGDHHTFSKSDLKRCATAGQYAPVTEEHPLYLRQGMCQWSGVGTGSGAFTQQMSWERHQSGWRVDWARWLRWQGETSVLPNFRGVR